MKTETVMQKIRDEYLRDSTVTVVLVGSETWKRKFVDWEIAASLRNTAKNPRSGLLGILLPNYPSYEKNQYSPYTIPPRLYYNLQTKYAKMYPWTTDSQVVQNMIHEAFNGRFQVDPYNSLPGFSQNRSGDRWYP